MWPLVRFSVVGEAWRLYKRHWVVWSLAMLIVLVGFSAVNGALSAVLKTGRGPHLGGFRLFLPASKPLAYVIATMVTSFFAGGMVRMASNQVRGLTPQIEDLFNVTDCWFDLLLFGFLASVLIAAGTFVCVIPGFIVLGLLMLGIPLVVDGRLPATGALIESWRALKSQWLTATLFHVFLIVAAAAGALLCGIGILCTGPLYSLSIAIVYRDFFPAGAVGAKHKPADPLSEF